MENFELRFVLLDSSERLTIVDVEPPLRRERGIPGRGRFEAAQLRFLVEERCLGLSLRKSKITDTTRATDSNESAPPRNEFLKGW